jgi:hypothetical protein
MRLSCTVKGCPQVPPKALTGLFVGLTFTLRLSGLGRLGRVGVTVRSGGLEATAGVAVNRAYGRRVSAGILAALLSTGLAACAGSADAPPSSDSTASASRPAISDSPASGGPADGRTQVLSHYAAFFNALPELSRMDEAERNVRLRQYLTGAAYTAVVKSMTAQAKFGKALYGRAVLQPRVASLGPNTALVRDCQDTSKSGVEDVKTGQKETRGIPRSLVVTNVQRTDGAWRISRIDYRGPKC